MNRACVSIVLGALLWVAACGSTSSNRDGGAGGAAGRWVSEAGEGRVERAEAARAEARPVMPPPTVPMGWPARWTAGSVRPATVAPAAARGR